MSVLPPNSHRARRAARPFLIRELHGGPTGMTADWHNLLVRGDNLPLMQATADGPLCRHAEAFGGLKLIYMDPPFAVGENFSMPLMPGGKGGPRALAYRDTWEQGLPAFLNMMRPRLFLAREALAADGSLFLHCDWRAVHHLRLMLDEIFGAKRFLGQIVWHYTGGGRSRRWFSRKHDYILHYAKSGKWIFNPDAVRVPYKESSGYARSGITSAAGKRYMPHPDGTPVDDVWDIPMVNPLARERCGYPTQKPLALLERILLAASNPGDLVADFFCGSGTTAVAAERLDRRWIVADASPLAAHTTKKRLMDLARQRPFVLAHVESGEDEAFEAEIVPHTAGQPGGRIRYRMGRVRAEAKALADGSGRFVVRLLGFSLTREDTGRDAPEALLPRHWQDRLAAWSVGPALGADFAIPGCRTDAVSHAVLWHSNRADRGSRDDRGGNGYGGLVLQSPALEPPPPGTALLVCLTDIFGNECRTIVPFPGTKS